MSWIEEAREAVKDMGLDTGEISEAVLVHLGPVRLWLSLDRARIAASVGDGNGTLEMDAWHTCETTHCMAGWAIHLAGPDGAALEAAVGPGVAGTLIYAASGSHPVPNFYASNEDALAEIKRRAKAAEQAPGGDGEVA